MREIAVREEVVEMSGPGKWQERRGASGDQIQGDSAVSPHTELIGMKEVGLEAKIPVSEL
jgi:hypothetical protein